MLSERQSSNDPAAADVMCEVLYMNGWVIWHRKESFVRSSAVKASSNLVVLDTWSDLLLAKKAGFKSRGSPADSDAALASWLQFQGMFDGSLRLSSAGQRPAAGRRAARQQPVFGISDVAKAFCTVYRGVVS